MCWRRLCSGGRALEFQNGMWKSMTPRGSNNLKAKDVRADGPSDASTTMPNRWCRKRGEQRKLEQVKNKLAESQEQCANPYAAAWKTAEEERPEPLIWTTASSDGRSADDVESWTWIHILARQMSLPNQKRQNQVSSFN